MRQLELQFQKLPYAVEEALNRLRINMKFCGKSTQKILVTSSIPGEGKSSVSIQLWKMLSEAGFKSVFIDADLRKSALKDRHQIICQHAQDLGYYLSGQAEYEDVIYETNIENGHYVPCFNLLENPSALLEDSRFQEMLDRMSAEYRYIIIDTPPLESVSDGALIASMCDGAVLIVKAGETSKSIIRNSMQQITRANCKLLGVVLNNVQTTGSAYRKYYGKYGRYSKYGYGYGPEGN